MNACGAIRDAVSLLCKRDAAAGDLFFARGNNSPDYLSDGSESAARSFSSARFSIRDT